MKIVVCNSKGGIGKTRISLNFYYTLKDYNIVTNDMDSPIHRILPKEDFLILDYTQDIPDLPKNANVIFDMGGFRDGRAIKIFKTADWIVVPTVFDDSDIDVTLRFIKSHEKYNRNIVVIANRTNRGEFEAIREAIGYYFDYPVFNLKKSRSIANIFSQKKSIEDMARDSILHKRPFKVVADQFTEIINYITKGHHE